MKRSVNPPMRFVLVTIGILLLVAVVNAAFSLGPWPIVIAIAVLDLAFIVYALKTKDHIIWLWLLFGHITGFIEVVSDCDAFLVEKVQVLVYPSTFPKIGVSPAYLPFAWGLVFTQLGLIGDWLRVRRSLLAASFITAGLGGVMISVYENLARYAGWWYYQNTPMLIWAPYFVTLFEFLSTSLFVLAGWRIAKASSIRVEYGWVIVTGIAMGVWMCVAMRFAFWLLGPCVDAVIQLPCEPVPLPREVLGL